MARISPLAIAGVALIGGLWLAERARPLRRQSHDTATRQVRNVAIGLGTMAVVTAIEMPLLKRIAEGNVVARRGLVQVLPLPGPLKVLIGVAAMDYAYYWWHIATHRMPILWRLHRVHHIDPDMDMTTALRFHAADMIVSLPFRIAQVAISGADTRILMAHRRFFDASVLFHHSNLRLPGRWDNRLSLVFTTPKMHGVHHSKVPEEMNSNWSSGISLWDRLHGTLRRKPQDAIDIGVADGASLADLPLANSQIAPFREMPEPLPPGSVSLR
ncbi:sterol desaturase family protein [Alteriqipengyuania lutimaris]|uniref:Fatty acid hydroxylase family protein n=1 Tax=Alteriqipengyuania lutimaris TaxID=1538146 RepID=A0A395LPD9_9SPHN|nr:sterol desaturase family protein [Alteriqipengyuania lutimaris]MBB3033587.1 sterol desaturase/sphingolipid hydroxylase (fatty acid hydroxylase superfamily) [Alteriqipengyuania lutimaris]RDS77414.1 fatty acid hydroxylase family protein [Alteriqipengyuania lutimaris]